MITPQILSPLHPPSSIFFLNDAAPPEISPLPLHDPLPISEQKTPPRALLVPGIYDRRSRQFLGMPKMMEAIGVVAPPSPPLSAAAEALLAADAALKQEIGRAHV